VENYLNPTGTILRDRGPEGLEKKKIHTSETLQNKLVIICVNRTYFIVLPNDMKQQLKSYWCYQELHLAPLDSLVTTFNPSKWQQET
jgi:hypothetical protein